MSSPSLENENQSFPAGPKGMPLWSLYYMTGPAPPLKSKLFYHPGPIGEVINRCKEHCSLMNYRFISVRPAISNLADDEKVHRE